MAIRRKPVKPEEHFTIVANSTLRDYRLSLKARGLLGLIMSHRIGWNVTLETLARDNPEGRAAIRSAVSELEEYGYLTKHRVHGDDGRFTGFDYELTYDPPSFDNRTLDQPTEVAPSFDYPTSDKPTAGNPTSENRTPKKNISKKTNGEEDHPVGGAPAGASKKAQGHRLPEGWRPSDGLMDQMRAERPDVDVSFELRKFSDYWAGVPGARGRKVDWPATFRNWVRNAKSTPSIPESAWNNLPPAPREPEDKTPCPAHNWERRANCAACKSEIKAGQRAPVDYGRKV